MLEPRRPSYIPPPITEIPPDLFKEERFWTARADLILEESSAREMIRSVEINRALLQSSLLEDLGLYKQAKGMETLQGHGTRVCLRSLYLLDQLRRDGSSVTADTRVLATSALLHDIGKLDPDVHDVVMYDGKIRRNEATAWTIIKRHPRIGREVIMAMTMHMPIDERLKVAEAIECHHERQDQKGYYQRHISQVPYEAQIIACADAIDVMKTPRPYAKPMTNRMIRNEIDRNPGQFQQEIAATAKTFLLADEDDILKKIN